MTASPLGRYGEAVAAVISIVIVFAAILAHTFPALGTSDTSWVDNAALLAIGVVLGQRATTNGAAKIALAAHQRLDAIRAPAANDGEGPTPNGIPIP